jgi:hypothetical protein
MARLPGFEPKRELVESALDLDLREIHSRIATEERVETVSVE